MFRSGNLHRVNPWPSATREDQPKRGRPRKVLRETVVVIDIKQDILQILHKLSQNRER